MALNRGLLVWLTVAGARAAGQDSVVAYRREPKLTVSAVALPLRGTRPTTNCILVALDGEAYAPLHTPPARAATNVREFPVVQAANTTPDE